MMNIHLVNNHACALCKSGCDPLPSVYILQCNRVEFQVCRYFNLYVNDTRAYNYDKNNLHIVHIFADIFHECEV